MSEEREEQSSNTNLIVICVALALGIGFLLLRSGDEPTRAAKAPTASEAPMAGSAGEQKPPASPGAPLVTPETKPGSAGAFLPSIAPNSAITVDASDLPEVGPLTVTVELPHVHEGEPLSGRVIAEGRHIEIQGMLEGGDGSKAFVDIPTDWLTPDTYLIELFIREKSPVPIRRYVLVVR